MLGGSCADPPARAQTPGCSESYGLCTARDVASWSKESPDGLIEVFVVLGAVDDIVRWNANALRQQPGFSLSALEEFRGLSQAQALAALTLAATAYNSADPFADPQWRALAGDLKDDLRVSFHAASFILDFGYEPWESALKNPPGLAAIGNQIVALAPSDNDMLLDLAHKLAFYGPDTLKPAARQLIDRFIASPNRSFADLARAANILARPLNDPDTADVLMDAGGHNARGYDTTGIMGHIAAQRLSSGMYDAASAQLLTEHLLTPPLVFPYWPMETLRRARASRELLAVGSGLLARARQSRGDALEAVELFAAASDAYRFAGEREKAISAAREGMSLIPMAIADRATITDLAERRKLAGEDNGMRIAPAIALYLSGAEEEALASGFVSGLQLLQRWEKPLNEFDPQWIALDTPKWMSVTVSEIVERGDSVFAGRVHDALAASPGSAEAEDLAVLAAVAGQADRVADHIEAIRGEANDASGHPSDRPFLLLRSVIAWKVAEILLERGRN